MNYNSSKLNDSFVMNILEIPLNFDYNTFISK